MHRIMTLLTAFILMSGLLACPAAAPAEAAMPEHVSGPAEPTGYWNMLNEISVRQFSEGPVTLNLLTGDDISSEDIRFWPFDAETGLYRTGEGEPAGDRVRVTAPEEPDWVKTVSLQEAGKYSLCGIPFYVLPPEDEVLSALAEEIQNTVTRCAGRDQKETAEKLYTWLLRRVKREIPENRPDLREACADPFNCLLTGYALPETYAPLYQLLLRCAEIRSLPVDGICDGMDHMWLICRLDGQWLYADPATDDLYDRADTRYFARSYETFLKDHMQAIGMDFPPEILGENGEWDLALAIFFRDWGPKNTVPEALKTLPATAKECGFPASLPDFWKLGVTLENGNYALQHPGRRITCYQFLELDRWGHWISGLDYHPEGIREFPHPLILNSQASWILRLTAQDYPENMRPVNRPSYRQIIEWTNGGDVEYSEYNYQVPMRRNEIKGFGEKSCRIFTYDMDLRPAACTWHLVSEAETLDVTAYFDGDGNTTRYRVSRAPAGENALVWEAEADGTVTYLSCVQDGKQWILDDLTDVYSQQRYRSFRGKIQFWYQDLITDDQPPEGGVHLYALSRTVDEAYAGYIQIAAADPLLRWTELGQLEFNPDAADLLGNPVRYDAFAPDLSPCERLKIGKQ